MVISFAMWADAQALISSMFMAPAMWRVYRHTMTEDGCSTTARLSLLLAAHGAVGAMFFLGLTIMAFTREYHIPTSDWLIVAAVWLTVVSTLGLLIIKSGITWLGERHGSTALWRWYVGLTAMWLAAGVFL